MTSAVRRLFATRLVLTSMALHIVLGAALTLFPLFDVLGFERAFATGLLATFTGLLIGVEVMKDARARPPEDRPPGGGLFGLGLVGVTVGWITLLPSVLLGLAYEVLTVPCNAEEGLLFMALCAGGNVVFASSVGVLSGSLFKRRGSAILGGLLVLSSALAASIHRLYAEPQIYVFDHAFGFWPGSLYDEALEVSTGLLAFRAYTLLISASALAAGSAFIETSTLALRPMRPRSGSLVVAVVGTSLCVWIGARGDRLGFDRDRSSIIAALSRRVTTPHFEIHIDPTASDREVSRIEEDHEFRHAQLGAFFRAAPTERITSFVYRDERQKTDLMGAGRTQISRPWAREIHIHGFDFPHPILKHELAHVFAAEWNQGLFQVPASATFLVNIGVVEGVAVAADWPSQELTVHEWARAMRELGLAPDPRSSLSVLGFWSISSARAYTIAGSFIRYLFDRYGVDRLAELYESNDFEGAYGRSLDALVGEWESFVDALPLSERSRIVAEHRFRAPGIFQRVCAHESANLEARGYERLAANDLEGARADLDQVMLYAPADPAPLVALSQTLARRGLLYEARAHAERALALDGTTAKSRAFARESLASIAWREGRREETRDHLRALLDMHLSRASDRLFTARLMALDLPADLERDTMKYLLGELVDDEAVAILSDLACRSPGEPLLHYLLGRRMGDLGVWSLARSHMDDALRLGLVDPGLMMAARILRARAFFETSDLEAAIAEFKAEAEDAPTPADRLDAEDWRARATDRKRRLTEHVDPETPAGE